MLVLDGSGSIGDVTFQLQVVVHQLSISFQCKMMPNISTIPSMRASIAGAGMEEAGGGVTSHRIMGSSRSQRGQVAAN